MQGRGCVSLSWLSDRALAAGCLVIGFDPFASRTALLASNFYLLRSAMSAIILNDNSFNPLTPNLKFKNLK